MTKTVLMKGNSVAEQKLKKKALLVIDVQENLLDARSRLHMDPVAVYPFISSLNKSIRFFEANYLPVIYIVNEWTNPILNALTGNVCKKGGKGTGIDKKVDRVNGKVYSKSRMNALTNKELSTFLRENAISELYITGLFAEACIKGTTMAAIRNDYKTVLIEDAIGSKNTKKKLASLLYCERKGANIISTHQLPDSTISKNEVNHLLTDELDRS
jgi:nicotinamidase-related amidase